MFDLDILRSPQVQAHIFASAMLAILIAGSLSLILIFLVGVWCLMQACAVLVESGVECLNAIGSAYNGADATVRLLGLVLCACAVYGLVARLRAKQGVSR